VVVSIDRLATEYLQLSMCYSHIHRPGTNKKKLKIDFRISSILFSILSSAFENWEPNNSQLLLDHHVEKCHMHVWILHLINWRKKTGINRISRSFIFIFTYKDLDMNVWEMADEMIYLRKIIEDKRSYHALKNVEVRLYSYSIVRLHQYWAFSRKHSLE